MRRFVLIDFPYQYVLVKMAYNYACTRKGNYNCLKIVQNPILRNTVNVSSYVWNKNVHRELKVESIPE